LRAPIPTTRWNTVPPTAQAAFREVVDSSPPRIADLEPLVGDLTGQHEALKDQNQDLPSRIKDREARLQLNSTNSSKPASSDPIGLKRTPPAPPSPRPRGGPPGHTTAVRPWVPPAKLRSSLDCKPTAGRAGGHALQGTDSDPLIHPVAELPKIEPLVDQSQLHRLSCPKCGKTTCGARPPGVPSGNVGPSLPAVLATVAGAYRL